MKKMIYVGWPVPNTYQKINSIKILVSSYKQQKTFFLVKMYLILRKTFKYLLNLPPTYFEGRKNLSRDLKKNIFNTQYILKCYSCHKTVSVCLSFSHTHISYSLVTYASTHSQITRIHTHTHTFLTHTTSYLPLSALSYSFYRTLSLFLILTLSLFHSKYPRSDSIFSCIWCECFVRKVEND